MTAKTFMPICGDCRKKVRSLPTEESKLNDIEENCCICGDFDRAYELNKKLLEENPEEFKKKVREKLPNYILDLVLLSLAEVNTKV